MLTFFKEFVAQERIHAHFCEYSNDGPFNLEIIGVLFVGLLNLSVDGIEVGMDLFQSTSSGEVCVKRPKNAKVSAFTAVQEVAYLGVRKFHKECQQWLAIPLRCRFQ